MRLNPLFKLMVLIIFSVPMQCSGGLAGLTNARANTVIVDSSGNIVTVGSITANGVSQAVIARYTTGGALDTTFNSTGYATAIFGDNTVFNGVVQQSNGQLVAVGTANLNTTPQWFAVRYNSNGSIDTAFGNQGFVTAVVGIASGANNVGQQSNGLIVLSGYSTGVTGGARFLLIRLTTAGVLDTSFGTGGMVTTTIGAGISASGQTIQPSNQYIVLTGGTGAWYAARYTTTGALDTTFGNSGIATINMGTGLIQYANAMALQSNGNIVLGGFVNDQFALARLTSTGPLDTSFGVNGRLFTPFVTGASAAIYSLALQTDGNLIAAGYDGSQIALARYLSATGALDNTYGASGIVTTSIGSFARVLGSAIQTSNDALVIAGYSSPNMFVSRYGTTGTVDSSFGVVSSPAVCSTALCAYGQIYNVSYQDVANNGAVVFDSNGILSNISHTTSSSNIVLSQAGTYLVTYILELYNNSLFELQLNGSAIAGSNYINPDSSISAGQAIFTANANDVLTLVNVSGFDQPLLTGGVNANLTIEMIA